MSIYEYRRAADLLEIHATDPYGLDVEQWEPWRTAADGAFWYRRLVAVDEGDDEAAPDDDEAAAMIFGGGDEPW